MYSGKRAAALLAVVVVLSICGAGFGQAASRSDQPRSLTWRFDENVKWNGWSPNGQIRDVQFGKDCVSFRTEGSDPIMIGPQIDWPAASAGQRVEIDIDCDSPGEGELFYTNKTTGLYGGFEGKWQTSVVIPSAGRQVVPVWPFWQSLGQIIRVRIDPPSDVRCRLHSIRIVEAEAIPGNLNWTFGTSETSWRAMCAAKLKSTDSGLHVSALRPMALIATGTQAFPAERRSILLIDADCPGERVISLYWATMQQPGLYGEPIELPRDGRPLTIDLRQFDQWAGTVTNLAIGFGSKGGETLTLRSLAIEENDPGKPFLRLKYLGLASGVARPGKPIEIRAILEHIAGPNLPAGQAVLHTDENAACAQPAVKVPALARGAKTDVRFVIVPQAMGRTRVELSLGGQTFSKELQVGPSSGEIAKTDYDVPPPVAVKTDYQIGIYYFPGWSPDQMHRWKLQADFPERDSLLGWYEEGQPAVADWHIKWAAENGITFFVYDWYWRQDNEELGAGLNEGFLKARYRDRMKFALMWANHKPFSGHTPDQLLQVTDYWIEHYLRRPNYLTVDDKPYVSFFAPLELVACLGSDENVRKAFEAMRERARAAGLPGLHIGAIETTGISDQQKLRQMGFDSFTAYNYVGMNATVAQSPYRHFMLTHEARWQKAQGGKVLAYIPLLSVGWDGPRWYGPRSQRRLARSTEDFAEGLRLLKANLDATGGKMAILEAWNEWGEGSYIEPNVEFGFGDLEAVRKTFARPGDWPTNVGPEDVGLGGQYDLRNEPAGCRAANRFGKVVESAGVNPAVTSGLAIRCWENRIAVEAGEGKIGQRTIKCAGGCVAIPPAETREVELPIDLNASEVKNWQGGNRLAISLNDRRNVLPGSYSPGSLRLSDPKQSDVSFEAPRDYIVDDTWGAFALAKGSRLKAGQHVVARYGMSLRRVDALVLDAQGRPQLITGTPSADCPEPPAVPDGMLHLANVYRPFNATTVEPQHIYVVTGARSELSPIRDAPMLAPVLAKLREGKSVTVVCWGDSVTACGESSTPATCYVGEFESMLKERFPKARIRFINAGIGGSSTLNRLKDFQKEVLDHKPDLVTLEYVNDMGLPAEMLQRHYSEILTRTKQAGAALIILTPHFVMPSWMNLTGGRGADGRAGVAFLRKFARENNVPLADASKRWELLEKQGVPYETLLRNGINHPEDRGHRIFAEELMRFFPAN